MNEKIGKQFVFDYAGEDYWSLIEILQRRDKKRLEENVWEFEALASGLKAKYAELQYQFKRWTKFKRKWVVTSSDCVSLIQMLPSKGRLNVLVYSRSLNVRNKQKSDLAWIEWVICEILALLYRSNPTIPRKVTLIWSVGSYHNY